jgi:hypothetical protein
MKTRPMALRFTSGLHVGERVEKLLPRVDGPEAIAEAPAERVGDALGLPCPQHAVVDEDAREPVADGLVDDRGGDGGIDAAGERADDFLVADLRPDALDSSATKFSMVQLGSALQIENRKFLQEHGALLAVMHLGVELDAPAAVLGVGAGGDRGIGAVGDHLPAGGQAFHAVAVAHPHRRVVDLAGDAGEEVAFVVDRDGGGAVLAVGGARDLAAGEESSRRSSRSRCRGWGRRRRGWRDREAARPRRTRSTGRRRG